MSMEILERRKGLYPALPDVSPPSKWRYRCDGCGLSETASVDDPPGRRANITSGMVSVMPAGDLARVIGAGIVFHYCRDNLRCMRAAALLQTQAHLDRCIDANGQLRNPDDYPAEHHEVSAVKADKAAGHCEGGDDR